MSHSNIFIKNTIISIWVHITVYIQATSKIHFDAVKIQYHNSHKKMKVTSNYYISFYQPSFYVFIPMYATYNITFKCIPIVLTIVFYIWLLQVMNFWHVRYSNLCKSEQHNKVFSITHFTWYKITKCYLMWAI